MIILMEVKSQEQVLKLFSACVVIISVQRNEQNTRFKHQICSNMVLSMLSGLQDPIGPYRILRNGSIGLFQITIWTTHLKKGISVSDNEIACNWILKKIYNTHWHFDRILQDLDRILPKILIGSYQGLLIAEIDFFQLKMWSRYLHRGCLLPIL